MNNQPWAAWRLVGLVFLAYGLTLFAGIFLDDATNLWHSQKADWSLNSLGQAFSFKLQEMHDGTVPKFLQNGPKYFRPLTVAMVKLETQLFKTHWWPYHLVNVALQACLAVLLFKFLCSLLGNPGLAWRSTVLYLFCFINVVTVTWLSTRGDLLCGMFCLIGLLAWQSFSRGITRLVRVMSWMGVMLAFILAMLSKETGAALPFLIGAFAYWNAAEQGKSSRVRWVRFALWGVPMFLLLGLYFALRHHVLGPMIIPDFYFYFFSPTSWLFPYFVAQKLVFSVLGMVLFLPPLHIKILMGIPFYNVLFPCAALPFLVYMYRVLQPRCKQHASLRILVPCFFLSLLPTLPILPFPQYFLLGSFFYCPILALFLFPEAPRSVMWSMPVGWKKWYARLYFAVFAISLLVVVAFFRWTTGSTGRVCESFREAYDSRKAHASSLGSERSCLAEFYVLDLDIVRAHVFSEFRFCYPEKNMFKGFFVNLLSPGSPHSKLSISEDELRVRSQGHRPFYTGLFFFGIFGPIEDSTFKETISCHYYDQRASELEVDQSTGNLGPRELLLTFNKVRSRPECRFFFRGSSVICP